MAVEVLILFDKRCGYVRPVLLFQVNFGPNERVAADLRKIELDRPLPRSGIGNVTDFLALFLRRLIFWALKGPANF